MVEIETIEDTDHVVRLCWEKEVKEIKKLKEEEADYVVGVDKDGKTKNFRVRMTAFELKGNEKWSCNWLEWFGRDISCYCQIEGLRGSNKTLQYLENKWFLIINVEDVRNSTTNGKLKVEHTPNRDNNSHASITYPPHNSIRYPDTQAEFALGFALKRLLHKGKVISVKAHDQWCLSKSHKK